MQSYEKDKYIHWTKRLMQHQFNQTHNDNNNLANLLYKIKNDQKVNGIVRNQM